MSIQHAYSQTVADGTATSVVRPSDWNSNHVLVQQFGGNTLGTSQISGQNLVWAGGNNVTLSANGSTVSIVGADTTQFLTTASPVNHAHNFATTTTNGANIVVGTANSAGATIGVPGFLTTASPVTHIHGFATTTTNGAVAVVGTNNSNGVTLANPAWITTYAAQTNQTQASGNIAGVGTTFAGTNVTATMALNSAGLGLSLSAPAGGGGGAGAAVSLLAGGNSTSGVGGYSNISSGTVQLAGGNNVTLSQAGNSITISGADVVWALSGNTAGTTSSNLTANSFIFQGGNNITLSGSNKTIVFSAANQTVDTNKAGIGYTSTTQGGSTVGITHNTAGLSMAWPPFITNAAGGGGFQAGVSTDAAGTTGLVASQIVFFEGNTNITLSQSVNGNSASLSIFAPAGGGGGGAGYTALTYQNRQLGASTQSSAGINSVWLCPMRVAAPVSASTLLVMQSITGTLTSAVAATAAYTNDFIIYKQNSTNATLFESVWSTQNTMQFWNSGTSSASYGINGVTSSSAGTALIANSVYGLRLSTVAIGSIMDTGLYVYGHRQSSSTAGYASFVRTGGMIYDNPLPAAKGYFGAATATSVGYNDGGIYSVTSASPPATLALSQIWQMSDVMPYVKIGAL